MKTVLKILGALLLAALLALGGLLGYVRFALPNVGPPPSITVKPTAELIARGKYLAHHVVACMDCHSERDWRYFSGPLKPGTLGRGGDKFDEELGFPGRFYAKNITPWALKSWTDGEIYRAITTGVTKDGEPLFPVMPYPAYGKMAKRDVTAIIAYLRTLKPIEHKVPASTANFPFNFILRTIPQRPEPMTVPDPKERLAYGKYLTTIAACVDCHTKAKKGKRLAGMDFAGGFVFRLPGGEIVRSVNITPDRETGIGKWSEAQFVARFKHFAQPANARRPVKIGEFQSYMPWVMYAGMTETDLKAIYAYLRTVKAVSHKVDRFSPKK